MPSFLCMIFRRIRSVRQNTKLLRNLDIGEGTKVALSNLDGMFPQLIHIGKNCIFAPQSMVLAHDASFYIFTGEYRVAAVTIGDNCFIGYGAIIMQGVRIGSNTVVGAGSIVTKDVPSNSVVAGVPARVISSLSEYLDKNKKGVQLLKAPYSGKPPVQINREDVANFRKLVYSKLVSKS